MNKTVKIFLFIMLGFLIFSTHIFAANEGDFGSYPTNYDTSNPKTKSWFIYDLKPGQSKDDSITVVNNSDKTLNIKIYPVDATTTSDGAFALLNENQRQSDVGSWVQMSKSLLTIAPRDRQEVPFTITIPKFATVGDHAGGIIIQEAKPPSSSSTSGIGLNIVSRVGTRIYETVPGAKVTKLDVRDFTYSIVNNHLVFSFVMENQGNVILTPNGKIDIKDGSGKIIDAINLINLGSVFPNKPTTLTAKSNITTPWFGKFNATVTINYSNTEAIAKSISFFIYIKDWRVVLPVPALILLIALFFIFRKMFYHAHKIHKAVKKATERGLEQGEKIKTDIKEGVKKTMDKMSASILTQPAYAPAFADNVDQMFIARHIKLLVVLISVSIIVLSSLFALILQQFVLLKLQTQASAAKSNVIIQPTEIPIPTLPPTPTNIPVNKSDMKINVLNGGTKEGAAKTFADILTKSGFNVINIDNASTDSAQTIIEYPQGELDGADQLQEALKPDYTKVSEQATDSSEFTIILGQ